MTGLLSFDDMRSAWLADTDTFDPPTWTERLPSPFTDDGELDPAQLRVNLLTIPADERWRYLGDIDLNETPEDYL